MGGQLEGKGRIRSTIFLKEDGHQTHRAMQATLITLVSRGLPRSIHLIGKPRLSCILSVSNKKGPVLRWYPSDRSKTPQDGATPSPSSPSPLFSHRTVHLHPSQQLVKPSLKLLRAHAQRAAATSPLRPQLSTLPSAVVADIATRFGPRHASVTGRGARKVAAIAGTTVTRLYRITTGEETAATSARPVRRGKEKKNASCHPQE